MIRIATAALASLIALSAAPAIAASSTDAPFQVAQNLDIRIGRDGDGVRERRVVRERRIVRERMRPMHHRDCRTVVVRRNTPNGTVTRRTRTCG